MKHLNFGCLHWKHQKISVELKTLDSGRKYHLSKIYIIYIIYILLKWYFLPQYHKFKTTCYNKIKRCMDVISYSLPNKTTKQIRLESAMFYVRRHNHDKKNM